MDLLVFVYATGAQDAMRTISDARAIEKFVKRFGHICEECTPEQLRQRLMRTRNEYADTLRSEPIEG